MDANETPADRGKPQKRHGPVRRYIDWFIAFFGVNPQSEEWEEEVSGRPAEKNEKRAEE